MKKYAMMMALGSMVVLAMVADGVRAEDDAKAAAAKPIKKMVGDPHKMSKVHERLAEMVGVWDVTMTVIPMPGAEPQKLTSVAKRTLMYDGKLVKEEAVWNIPGMGGENHFTFLYGYNTGTNDFEKMEVGQDTTQINLLTGPWDGKRDEIEIRGHHGRVSFGKMEYESRTVISFERSAADNAAEGDDDKDQADGSIDAERHRTYTIMGAGEEFLQWEFHYTRRTLGAPDMIAARAYSAPGESHKRLGAMIGTFEAEVEFKMSSMPKPVTMKGKAVRDWKVKGLILEETAEWGGGMKMHYLYSFHNGKQMWELIYMHGTGSGFSQISGKPSDDGVIRMSGMVWDPFLGDEVLQKIEQHPEKDGVSIGTMTLAYGGKEFSHSKFTYRRVETSGK